MKGINKTDLNKPINSLIIDNKISFVSNFILT